MKHRQETVVAEDWDGESRACAWAKADPYEVLGKLARGVTKCQMNSTAFTVTSVRRNLVLHISHLLSGI
jgi:hypothetical protein